RLSGAALDHRNYDCIAYNRQRAQIRFNVAELDAVSAEIYLFVDAGFKKYQAVTKATQVARFVCAQATILAKSPSCEIGAPSVTGTYVRPCNNDFAAPVSGQLRAVLIDDEDFRTGHHATHW